MGWQDLDNTSWDPLSARSSVQTELDTFYSSDDPVAQLRLARKLLNENAPTAVVSIVWLACHSTNERVRLSASQEILTRTLGPAKEQAQGSSDALTSIVEAMVQGAN